MKNSSVFAIAKGPSKGLLNEAIYTTKTPLPLALNEPTYSSRNDKLFPNAKSDYTRKAYYDDEGHIPIPESRSLPANPQSGARHSNPVEGRGLPRTERPGQSPSLRMNKSSCKMF